LFNFINHYINLFLYASLIKGLPLLFLSSLCLYSKSCNKYSIISLCISFVFIVVLFYCCEHVWDISIPQSILGYAICGVIWGLSFIIPGFSSSTLLLFFGIYGPMSAGIKSLDLKVVVPLGLTMLATLLLLSRAMKAAFEKIHSIASHSVMGFVLATTLMLFTVTDEGSPSIISTFRGVNIAIYIGCIVGGVAASFLLSKLFEKLRASAQTQEESD
jgi:putative membrane protein